MRVTRSSTPNSFFFSFPVPLTDSRKERAIAIEDDEDEMDAEAEDEGVPDLMPDGIPGDDDNVDGVDAPTEL